MASGFCAMSPRPARQSRRERTAGISGMTAELKLPDGRARVVQHGHGPARKIATGIGAVEVARPKVRDRGATGSASLRRSCRCGRGGRRAWTPCCRSSICAASQPAISRRRSRRAGRSLPRHAAAALLATQDSQRAQQASEFRAERHEESPAGHLDGAEPSGRGACTPSLR